VVVPSVSIFADGWRIVAWDGAARWQPDSGQFLFDFDAQAVAPRIAAPARPAPPAAAEPPSRAAAEWFDLGCELQAASPDEARVAYRQALELDPTLADAHVNLGRVHRRAGDAATADSLGRRAAAMTHLGTARRLYARHTT